MMADAAKRFDCKVARIELEQKLLGWALYGAVDPAVCDECTDLIPHFEPLHPRIFDSISAARRNGTDSGPAAIALAMAADEALREVGGLEYLRNLSGSAPAAISPEDGQRQFHAVVCSYRTSIGKERAAARAHDVADALASGAPDALDRAVDLADELRSLGAAQNIAAHPFIWVEPSTIPTRKSLFGRHAYRGFVSATAAPGGTGKTALACVETPALVSGRNLLNDAPVTRGRAWYLGLEDPLEEYQRRFAATALLHRVNRDEIEGQFFLNSGRDGRFVMATDGRSGIEIFRPVVEAVTENVRRNGIDLVIVDPFVAVHAANEQDNGAMAAVVREWANIANEVACAVELVHHVRKGGGNGQEPSADDARGASAIVNACRSMRLLVGMTADEAARASVDDRRRFFRVTNGKANLSLHGSAGQWRELVSVNLGNGNGGPDDQVGAVAPWRMPDASDLASQVALAAILEKLRKGEWRADAQATAWAGRAVADELGRPQR